ncbi:MAG: class I SAM-dependent methyltransferase [Verrucomicrobiota bacterium]|nr:class I SAM-dependent methyltransferase [Verrucomicrobiota bacterium]
MNETERGQVTRSAAEVYEDFFVPALFQQWASRVADAAGIQSGHRVLDVACGTGVVACVAAARVGSQGSVAGIDINEGMLAVASGKAPHIDWRRGPAEALPFTNDRFDAVVCQFGLMFFEDPRAALQEMWRVLRPTGRLAVAVWDSVESSPGYAALTRLVLRLFGSQAADALRAPFKMGDARLLSSLFAEAGIAGAQVTKHAGTARFPSLQSWLFTEIKGWVLAGVLDDAQFELLLRNAEETLESFVAADGTVAFDAPAVLITACRLQPSTGSSFTGT